MWRVLLACILVCAAANAKKFPLAASSGVPAARGEVETDTDRNGNVSFKVKVEHLATPASLSPPKNTYVVWLRERGGEPTPVGQLRVDKNLNGSFEGVTPSKNFDLFITAEPDPNVRTPTG